MSSPFNACSTSPNSYFGCDECGAFSHAVQALVSWPENNLSIDTFSTVSQTHDITIRIAFSSNFRIPTKSVAGEVLEGVVLE